MRSSPMSSSTTSPPCTWRSCAASPCWCCSCISLCADPDRSGVARWLGVPISTRVPGIARAVIALAIGYGALPPRSSCWHQSIGASSRRPPLGELLPNHAPDHPAPSRAPFCPPWATPHRHGQRLLACRHSRRAGPHATRLYYSGNFLCLQSLTIRLHLPRAGRTAHPPVRYGTSPATRLRPLSRRSDSKLIPVFPARL